MTTGTDKRTKSTHMRDIEVIDAELRLLWRAWRVAREMGCAPNTAFIDALLDERASRLAIPDRGDRQKRFESQPSFRHMRGDRAAPARGRGGPINYSDVD
jgi:hypothetical protein